MAAKKRSKKSKTEAPKKKFFAKKRISASLTSSPHLIVNINKHTTLAQIVQLREVLRLNPHVGTVLGCFGGITIEVP